MSGRISLTTTGLPPGQAAEMWRDLFCTRVMSANPRYLDAARFGVDFDFIPGGLFSLLKANMASVEHSRGAAELAADGDRRLSLLFVPRGRMRLTTGDHRIELAASSVALSPHDEAHIAAWHKPTKVKTIEFSADLLEAAGAPKDRYFTIASGRDPRIAMIERYSELLWNLDARTRTANLARSSDYLASMVVDVLHAPGPADSGLARDLRRLQLILALVAESYADPALTIAEAGRRLNLSPRAISEAMTMNGQTFNRALIERRLNAVADRLTAGDERISDCALACGFSDISYFNREFRRRFGQSPRTYRATRTWKN